MVYISSWMNAKDWLERYPEAVVVPNDGYLEDLDPGIKKAMYDCTAPKEGKNWRIIHNTFYTTVVEVW